MQRPRTLKAPRKGALGGQLHCPPCKGQRTLACLTVEASWSLDMWLLLGGRSGGAGLGPCQQVAGHHCAFRAMDHLRFTCCVHCAGRVGSHECRPGSGPPQMQTRGYLSSSLLPLEVSASQSFPGASASGPLWATRVCLGLSSSSRKSRSLWEWEARGRAPSGRSWGASAPSSSLESSLGWQKGGLHPHVWLRGATLAAAVTWA